MLQGLTLPDSNLSNFIFRQDLLDIFLAFRMKAKKLNRLRRKKLVAIKFRSLFNIISFPQLSIFIFFPARRAGLGFATFFRKVAKKRNPNNPVDPV